MFSQRAGVLDAYKIMAKLTRSVGGSAGLVVTTVVVGIVTWRESLVTPGQWLLAIVVIAIDKQM